MNRQYAPLSGVAIALIVLNHGIHFGLQVSPVEGIWLRVLIVLQALGGFAVPAFLFVSGAFLSYAARAVSLPFVRNSLERILWPYVIWSSIFFVLIGVTTGTTESVPRYVWNVLVGYPYHFVPMLILWYVAAPLCIPIARRHGAALVFTVGLYQTFLLMLRFPAPFVAPGSALAWVHVLRPPVVFTPLSDWAIYFPLGLVLGLHASSVSPHLLRARWPLIAATSGLFLLGILNAFGLVSAPWARFAAPLPLMLLLPVIERNAIPFVRFFEVLGRRSYGIYLVHFVVLNLLVFLAEMSRFEIASRPLIVFPTFVILALGAPLLVMELMAKLPAARNVYRYVFGISPPIPRTPGRAGVAPGSFQLGVRSRSGPGKIERAT